MNTACLIFISLLAMVGAYRVGEGIAFLVQPSHPHMMFLDLCFTFGSIKNSADLLHFEVEKTIRERAA